MSQAQRIINIFFFLLLSVVITLYLYNEAYVSEDERLFRTEDTVIKHIARDIQNNLQSLSILTLQNGSSSIGDGNSIQGTVNNNDIKRSFAIPTEEQFQANLQRLMIHINQTLTWASLLDSSKDSPLQWDKLAVADLHILRKLLKYLQNERDITLAKVLKGHQCSVIQKSQQKSISEYITMDICSEIEWYKLAHLTFPEAKLIFDVGGNKGYLGSLFVGLWGGGGYKLNPAALFELSKSTGVWKGSRNPAGYCKDGLNYATPLTCYPNTVPVLASPNQDKNKLGKALGRDANGHCTQLDESVHIHSFDGSSYLRSCVQSLTKTLSENNKQPKALQAWTYHHNAMSDNVGTVRFTKQGASQSPGFEGGRIRTDSAVETEEVNMTSVDTLLKNWNLQGKLDILKIDTEGNDNKVIVGANRALRESIGLLTFEGGGGVTFSKTMSDELNAIGFSCYSTSRAGLFKWNADCMVDEFFGTFRNKDKGNIFCVSRYRAPLMALAFDALSFPLLLHSNYERSDITELDKMSLDKASLAKSFVHIKKFCEPWPKCVTF